MRIFISYSRRDAGDFAESLRDSLIHKGHQVFTDVKNIQGGDKWSNVIEENIKSCDIFIVLLTFFSIQSPEVEKEVLLAKKENKRIIPCIYKGIDFKDIKWDLQEIQGPIFEDKFDLVRKIRILQDVDRNTRIPLLKEEKEEEKFESRVPNEIHKKYHDIDAPQDNVNTKDTPKLTPKPSLFSINTKTNYLSLLCPKVLVSVITVL